MRNSKLDCFTCLKKEDSEYLYGKVYKDNRFPNGHLVLTTKIKEIDENRTYAITENNTKYTLENELSNEDFANKIREENIDKVYAEFLLKPLYN